MLLAAVLLCGALGTGCQVTLTAGIDAGRDGTGWVRAGIGLDEEAVRELGDLSVALRLDDLRQAGWEVEAPRREDDGLTWVRAAKRFESAAEAASVAAELSGPEGPFRELRLERERSLFKTKLTFTGLVDLANGLAGLNDAALQERLGDADLALDLEGLRRRFGDALEDTVDVRLEARLPGDVEAASASSDGDSVVWSPAMGESVQASAVSESWNVQPLVPAAAAVLLAVAALGAFLVKKRR